MKFLMDFIMPPLRVPTKCTPTSHNNNNVVQSTKPRTKNIFFTTLLSSNEDVNMWSGGGATSSMHSCQAYVSKVLSNLNELRLSSRFCDVDIVVENRIFQAHRAVLAASSPYFQAMFTGGLCEQDQQSVQLHAITADIFEVLLDFIYSGDVCITQNNVQELIVAADMLELADVVSGCTAFLIKELHPLNAIGIYRFASDHNWVDLKMASHNYIEMNFPKVCNEDEIYELYKDDFNDFLLSENLKIDSEFQVFESALKWINYDILARRQYVFDILRNIRFPLLPHVLLEKAIGQCNDNSLRVALKSIHNDLINKKGCLMPLNVYPRKNAKRNIYVIGGSKRELHSVWDRGLEMKYVSMEKFDTCTRKWHKVPDMTVNRLVPGVAALNGHIYVVGGEEDTAILSSCERFDPQTNQWTQIASMVISRCEFGLCTLDGYLYAMGGWVDTDISGSIERYDPKTDKWRLVGSLPEPRFSMGLVTYDGLIYMVGGCSLNQRNLKDLISYNPFTGEWRKLPSMSVARFQMGCAVLDDFLYVVGGTNSQEVLNSVERYSFKQNKWMVVPPMTVERGGPACVSIDGVLYVIGGAQTYATPFYRAQCTIASVECFDPLTNTWSDCPPLSETRAEAGAVVI